jgi:hypothetical protein
MGYGVTPKFKRNGWARLKQMICDELPSPTDEDADWPEHARDVEPTVILKACMAWMRSNGQQAHVTHRGLFKQLKQFGWEEGQRTNARKKWRAPSRAEAVAKNGVATRLQAVLRGGSCTSRGGACPCWPPTQPAGRIRNKLIWGSQIDST